MTSLGRRSGSPDTRAEILTAAREVFAEAGYDRATIRAIASRAGVDPALVHHYFGTKHRLFSESISLPFSPAEAVEHLLAGDLDEAGPKLARLFFTVWEADEARASLLGMLRTALGGDDRAVTAFRQFIVEAVEQRIAPRIGQPDAEMRVLAVASQLVGMAIVRYVVQIEPLASAPVDELVDLVGPRIQSYLDGRAPG
jgi:AcrR family transcriptional regulator